jgi:hypothetical protein
MAVRAEVSRVRFDGGEDRAGTQMVGARIDDDAVLVHQLGVDVGRDVTQILDHAGELVRHTDDAQWRSDAL